MSVNGWIENVGEMPDYKVDIKLSCDEPDIDGVQVIRYTQDPEDWDWQIPQRCGITHFRKAITGEDK